MFFRILCSLLSNSSIFVNLSMLPFFKFAKILSIFLFFVFLSNFVEFLFARLFEKFNLVSLNTGSSFSIRNVGVNMENDRSACHCLSMEEAN